MSIKQRIASAKNQPEIVGRRNQKQEQLKSWKINQKHTGKQCKNNQKMCSQKKGQTPVVVLLLNTKKKERKITQKRLKKIRTLCESHGEQSDSGFQEKHVSCNISHFKKPRGYDAHLELNSSVLQLLV